MTTLECMTDALGWQGGTIHQVKEHFAVIDLKEQDRLCGRLLANMSNISDIETVQYFTKKRLENLGMVMASAQVTA